MDQACREMEHALSIARNLGQPYHLGNILFLYAQVEAMRKNTQTALEMARESEVMLLQVFEPSHPTVQYVNAFIKMLGNETD